MPIRRLFSKLALIFMAIAGMTSFSFADAIDDSPFESGKKHEITSSQNKPEENHEFMGRHLIVSYFGCDDKAIRDVKKLEEVMKAAIKACGATLLKSAEYVFPPDATTMVFLLSESHASIHTYPEFKSCFVDLFTCGTNCSAEKFDMVLREYLRPMEVNSKVLLRHQGIEEDRLREPALTV